LQDKHGNWHIQLENISQSVGDEISGRSDVTAVGWSEVFNSDAEQPYYGDITLTELGYEYGSSGLDRHNLLFQVLHKALGIPEERADHEACLMEHAISDESMKKWEAYIKSLDL